jgi:hypothetical protein
VEAPRLGQASKKALSDVQALAVIAAVSERRNAMRWSVGLACGLRQGEAVGLRGPGRGHGPDLVSASADVLSHGCDDPAACCERRHKRP